MSDFSSKSISHRLRIMTVGDSITDHGNVFRRRLAELLEENKIPYCFVGSKGKSILHEGHSGATTADINKSITSWIQAHQPNIVMLMIGTNDVWRKMSLTQAIANLNDSFSKILSVQPQVHVMIAKILPMEPEASNVLVYNDLLEKIFGPRILAGEPITIVDMFTGFQIDEDLKDGVHPNSVGYKKIAECWFQFLQELIQSTFNH